MVISTKSNVIVRQKTREKYSNRFKTEFKSAEEFIEHFFNKKFEPKEIEDHLEKSELEKLHEEYRRKTIFVDGKPLRGLSSYKNDERII